ncbi:MAG: hypothetical protein ABIA74_02455 [bacterium]
MKFSKSLFFVFLVCIFSLNLNAENFVYEFEKDNISYKITIPKDLDALRDFENTYLDRNYKEESTREKIQKFYNTFFPAIIQITNKDKNVYNVLRDPYLTTLSKFGHETALFWNPKLANLNLVINQTILAGIPISIFLFYLSQTLDQSDISMCMFITTFFITSASALTQMGADALNYLGFISNPYHNEQFTNMVQGYVERKQVKVNVSEINKKETFFTVRYLIKKPEFYYDNSFFDNLFQAKNN